MKKHVLVCALIILLSSYGFAQEVSVMFNMGIGTFRMKTQKELQDDLRGSQIPWRPVHKFPPYWTYGGSVSLHTNQRFGTSLSVEFGSTGGTLHYADYSGTARTDQLLKYTQVGVGTFFQVNKSETWPLFVTAQMSISRTKENISYAITVGDATDKDSEDFHSLNIGLRPGLMLHRRLNSFLFQANFGLEMQVPGRLETDGGTSLQQKNGDNVYAQWSGLRAGLGVGLILGKKKEKE
jgi:hypothetical protein